MSLPIRNGSLGSKSMSSEFFDLACKVMLVGDSGVGKTCILLRFKDGTFLGQSFISTVGIDFRNKIVTIDGIRVKMQIWDPAGQERFRSITRAYYRDAADLGHSRAGAFSKSNTQLLQGGTCTRQTQENTPLGIGPLLCLGLLLLYDVTDRRSFDNVRAWLAEIREYTHNKTVIMLLGNKADLMSQRVIRTEDGERIAKEFNVAFMETSAKSGLNVELAFQVIARDLIATVKREADEAADMAFDPVVYVEEQRHIADNERQRKCCSIT